MTPFEEGFFTKLAGITSAVKKSLKSGRLGYAPTAAALGLAGGVGGELAFGAYDAVDKDPDYSFKDDALLNAGFLTGAGLLFGRPAKAAKKAKTFFDKFRKAAPKAVAPNSLEYFKKLKLTKGADPLVEMKKGKQLYKPALGAAAGGYINYDEDNKLESIAKGAITGGAIAAPFMFKGKNMHQGLAHRFADEAIDSPGYLAAMGAMGALGSSKKKPVQPQPQPQQWNQQNWRR